MSIESLARPEIVAMKPYSSARKEAPSKGVLLNANELPWSLLENTDFNRYPDPQPEKLVSRLARLYDVPADHLLVTRGSDEGIDLLTRVFCRAGSDAILHCPPTFGMYKIAAQTQGADIIPVHRLPEEDFRVDKEDIIRALAEDARIKLVFLTSPNNPTGDVISEEFLLDVTRAASGRALVVVDEAYAEFCEHPSAVNLVDSHDNLVVLRTLSKAWAAAGLRCGTVVAQEAVISLLRRIIAPYPLPSPVVSLACQMLDREMLKSQQKMLAQLKKNKDRLLSILENRSFILQSWPGEANFVLIKTNRAGELLEFCARRSIILRGYPHEPGLEECIRISVGSWDEMSALESAFDAWENAA
jgi:histidinol-phosphate aminotransferase